MKRVEVIIMERRIAEVTHYEETVFVQQFIILDILVQRYYIIGLQVCGDHYAHPA